MPKLLILSCAVFALLASTAAESRSSGGSGSGGRSSGLRATTTSASRSTSRSSTGSSGESESPSVTVSAASRAGRYSPSPTGGYRTSQDGTQARVSVTPSTTVRMFAARSLGSSNGTTGSSAAAGFRSLSARPAAPTMAAPSGPSPRLQAIITQRQQTGGSNWLGTAALVWLLSRHDLSAEDRDWVEAQISQQATTPNVDANGDVDINRTAKGLAFSWDGLPVSVNVGQPVNLTITAIDTANHKEALTCSLTGPGVDVSLKEQVTDSGVTIHWKPTKPGVVILDCDSIAEGERRALQVL
jgi:hypothetical protein